MMAAGVILVIFGSLMMHIYPAVQGRLMWRDLFTILPIVLGALLCFASGVVWLWRNMP